MITTTMKKQHIPAPGFAQGLRGGALCGRFTTFETGDHRLIRSLAFRAHREGDAGHYCAHCMRELLRRGTVD